MIKTFEIDFVRALFDREFGNTEEYKFASFYEPLKDIKDIQTYHALYTDIIEELNQTDYKGIGVVSTTSSPSITSIKNAFISPFEFNVSLRTKSSERDKTIVKTYEVIEKLKGRKSEFAQLELNGEIVDIIKLGVLWQEDNKLRDYDFVGEWDIDEISSGLRNELKNKQIEVENGKEYILYVLDKDHEKLVGINANNRSVKKYVKFTGSFGPVSGAIANAKSSLTPSVLSNLTPDNIGETVVFSTDDLGIFKLDLTGYTYDDPHYFVLRTGQFNFDQAYYLLVKVKDLGNGTYEGFIESVLSRADGHKEEGWFDGVYEFTNSTLATYNGLYTFYANTSYDCGFNDTTDYFIISEIPISTHDKVEFYKLDLSFDSLRVDLPQTLNGEDFITISFSGSATLTSRYVMLGNDLVQLGIKENTEETTFTYLEPLDIPNDYKPDIFSYGLSANGFKGSEHIQAYSSNIAYTFILDTSVSFLYDIYKQTRYLTNETPNKQYKVQEITSSFGVVELNEYVGKMTNDIQVEKNDTDVMSITIPFSVVGESE